MRFSFILIGILLLTSCFKEEITPQPPLIEFTECITVCGGNIVLREFHNLASFEYCAGVNKPMCDDWRERAREVYQHPFLDFLLNSISEEVIHIN